MYLHTINFAALNRQNPNIAHKEITTTKPRSTSKRAMHITHRILGVGGSGCTITGVCTCIVQLLVALQMLMTLEMPLSTTMALPVTSKPIESTAENLAWQAWIMLPPEQKQLMKSRKVTPKSIFTLPLRVQCPEGHQQVDTKCIPTVIGSNAVLIDPNVLGLVLGNVPTDFEYDYEDEGSDDRQPNADTLSHNPPLYLSASMETEKSSDDATLELKPPSRDEPLKFNIFQSKYPTDDYAMEDYSAVSNEGTQTQEAETNLKESVAINETISISFNVSANITTERDLVSEASNVSKVHSFTTLPDSSDFNLDDIDAISLPASGNHKENSQKISLFKEDSSLHLVTTDMDTESAGDIEKEYVTHARAESDLDTLLQTESLMPMINQTATIPESLSLTTAVKEDRVPGAKVASSSAFFLNIEGEEVTTVPSIIEKELDTMETQDKAEFIRSVTMNSLGTVSNQGDGIEVTTLTPSTSYDEPSETKFMEDETATSPTIQLDDTTIIESNGETSSLSMTIATESSLSSSTPVETSLPSVGSTLQPMAEELTTQLWQQEQALKDFEELQRMRKGQKDQHTVMKKSKVEGGVGEVLAATTTTNVAETMPSQTTKSVDELITAPETETATVTPLLTAHNNDRFYYKHFAKHDLKSIIVSAESQQQQPSSTRPTSWPTAIETTLASTVGEATSEIDLAQELRLINDLVKGKRPSAKATTNPIASTTASTTTEKKSPTISGTISTSTSTAAPVSSSSESSVNSIKSSPATTDIWSKIMPFIQTTTNPTKITTTQQQFTTTSERTTTSDDGTTSSFDSSSSTATVVGNRSHRNSKIIRINGFNTIHTTPPTLSTTPTRTTTTEDISSISTTTKTASTILADASSSSAEGSSEPFWWLPVAWRLDKPSTTTTTTIKPDEAEGNSEELPLLLRFWSAYHAPRSS